MAATGLAEEVFWDSTPRQTHRAIKATEARHKSEEIDRRWHTWHAAVLPNLGKKLPSFEDFIKPLTTAATTSKPQTMEQQIAIARQWTAAIDAANRPRRSVVNAGRKSLLDVDQEVPGLIKSAKNQGDPRQDQTRE